MNFKAVRLLIPFAALVLGPAWAEEPTGEALEASPEALDAAFSEADAAREAAAWSNEIIDRRRPDPIAAMTKAADWVVRATVLAQDYIDDDRGLTFTHTTFRIDEAIKGDGLPSEFTLVQQGGIPSGRPDEIAIVSHTQFFNVGEEDLLFLTSEGNGTSERALAINHRFRILQERVYDENGRGVLLQEREGDGAYRMSVSQDRHPDPRFSHIQIGPHRLTKHFRGDHGVRDFRLGSEQPLTERTSYQSSIGISDFTAVIRSSKGDAS